MSRPIGLMDVKQALRDSRFHESLPIGFREDLQKYLNNPGCACNIPLYKKIMTDARKQLQEYFPNRIITNLDEEVKKLAENHWRVINCKAEDLEKELMKLPSGRKQIAVARYENMVTVVVNELDIIY
jgi:hypothetical protein